MTAGASSQSFSFHLWNNKKELAVSVAESDDGRSFTIKAIVDFDEPGFILHWGLSNKGPDEWLSPGPLANVPGAAQTPFVAASGGGTSALEIALDSASVGDPQGIVFVLAIPEKKQWIKNGNRNFYIPLRAPKPKRQVDLKALHEGRISGERISDSTTNLSGGSDRWELATTVATDDTKDATSPYRVFLTSNSTEPLTLHWGVCASQGKQAWLEPPERFRPEGTKVVGNGKAADTPWTSFEGGGCKLDIVFAPDDRTPVPAGIVFVVREGSSLWLKNERTGSDLFVPLKVRPPSPLRLPSGAAIEIKGLCAELVRDVVDREMNHDHWSLCSRFRLANDWIGGGDEAMPADSPQREEFWAYMLVWLRYSNLRVLDWQRKSHTQPRDLSSMQDKLTGHIVDRFRTAPRLRWIIRLVLACIGRGGTPELGQRIRDDILKIMRNHRAWKKKGFFMEEWHQKLHNNTTADDIDICRAYLAYLRSNGNLGEFWRVLTEAGITRERLASYDQPITTDPDFVGHIKDILIRDCENYLQLLKAVHLGTDLTSAINNIKGSLDGDLRGKLESIERLRHGDSLQYLWALTDSRAGLGHLLAAAERGDLRELVYLDISLEAEVRRVVEGISSNTDRLQLVNFVRLLLRNAVLSDPTNPLWPGVAADWARLADQAASGGGLDTQWFMRAQAIVERVTNVLNELVDKYTVAFQEKAEVLGSSFHADKGVVTLFTDELIRGSYGFGLSILLRRIGPMLRKGANMGNWQVISNGSGQASGKVLVLDKLMACMDMAAPEGQAVIVSRTVGGDEELPDWVAAVVTSDTPDVLSHVAVRARNERLLFATCFDGDTTDRLNSMQGRFVSFSISATGDVNFEESASPPAGNANDPASGATGNGVTSSPHLQPRPVDHEAPMVIPSTEFNASRVGGKSNNLARLQALRAVLHSWIHFPSSVALPFGSFDRALAHSCNVDVKSAYLSVEETLSDKALTMTSDRPVLARLREIILGLKSPPELPQAINTQLTAVGHEPLSDSNWPAAFTAIKGVWASKWNDRAYASRCKVGLAHSALHMAVLVQQVVDSRYAFVIHTTNPIDPKSKDLYGEVVVGLGETLVGNYPGRAFSFSSSKEDPTRFTVLGYPSKAVGLFGGGLIFRSDSNGEDLEAYAGAGLYDSVMMSPPSERVIDYSSEALVWDAAAQKHLIERITSAGAAIEKALNGPQDIEGVISTCGDLYIVQARPQV